jgi:lysozyme
MRTSINGLNLIKKFESLHDGDLTMIGLQPKICPANVWTEGWGRAMRINGAFIKGASNKKLAYANATIKTPAEADKALLEDLNVFERIVFSKIKIKLTQNQFDALVCHAYNTGGSDGLFKLINRRAPEDQIKKWWTTKYITGGGKTLNGLIRRRNDEYNLFIK